ncbi:DUF7144 family membrane protein [Tomitella biformata]|uniref:DUF7144 family membrane protein n=1 Tax=Tomitella biformata TaxID=630403 RepID=UPI000467CFBD|nr:hypothetical protein [Tomitella biformata]
MNTQTANKWGLFAGLLMIVIGAFHTVEGLVALLAPARLFVQASGLLLLDIERWGVALLIWGILMIIGGGVYLVGARWARPIAYALAVLTGFGQLVWLSQVLWLSVLMILASLVLIGALVLAGRGSTQPTAG